MKGYNALFLTLLFFLSACGGDTNAPVKSSVAIQIISDDSGVFAEPVEGQEYKLKMFAQLADLRKQYKYSKARIDVISSSYGRSVWVGNIADLRQGERAEVVVQAIDARADYCPNLAGAFRALASNINTLMDQGVNEIHVIVFSSLIHTPRPCEGVMAIRLPQLPPVGIDINDILMSNDAIKSVSFYWAHPAQRDVWADFLEPTRDAMLASDRSFSVLDMESSKYQLEQKLLGVGR